MILLRILTAISLMCLALGVSAMEDIPDAPTDRLVGDVGAAVYGSQLNIGTQGTQAIVLPYGFFEYQRAFVRIDTVGVKTLKMGYGHLELVGKIMLDNYNVTSPYNGSTLNKLNPIPIGLGTFQETPIGGFFINAYHDFGQSRGALYEVQYFAELKPAAQLTLYPLAGIERQTTQFANYYYGVSTANALQTGYTAYNAAGSNNLMAGMLVEIPLVDNWILNVYGKRKWMGAGINNSPVMTRSFQDNGFVAVAYRFK